MKSWRAPLTILVALAAGLGFSLAHHFMGSYLHLKPVEDVSVYVSQAWITRFGTAFAFVVKTTLAISIGTAYIQRQWMRFHLQSFKTAEVDLLTGLLGNAFSLFSSPVWLRHPMLTLLAVVSW